MYVLLSSYLVLIWRKFAVSCANIAESTSNITIMKLFYMNIHTHVHIHKHIHTHVHKGSF